MSKLMDFLIFGLITVLTFGCAGEKKEIHEVPQNATVMNGAVMIDYNVCGNGDTTLLFVHGWCINQTYWDNQVEAFCKDYKVVTLDLPGFGHSAKNRTNWTVEAYGDDVATVISKLKLKNVILIGHSMGGDVILEAALKKTDEVIALVGVDNFKEVGIVFDEATKGEIDFFIGRLKKNFDKVAPEYADIYLIHSNTGSLIRERVMNDFSKAFPDAAIGSFESLVNYYEKEPGQLGRLKQPLFLINSNAGPTDTAALNKTGITYSVLDVGTTGHYPMIEKPEEFNRLLKEVIESIN